MNESQDALVTGRCAPPSSQAPARSSGWISSVFHTLNRERKLCAVRLTFNSRLSKPAEGAWVVHRFATASTENKPAASGSVVDGDRRAVTALKWHQAPGGYFPK